MMIHAVSLPKIVVELQDWNPILEMWVSDLLFCNIKSSGRKYYGPAVILYFDLLLPVDLNERIQAGESDSTIYYNCDDHFSHVDYDNETDQVLGNCQEVSSSEGTLDREGILMLYI